MLRALSHKSQHCSKCGTLLKEAGSYSLKSQITWFVPRLSHDARPPRSFQVSRHLCSPYMEKSKKDGSGETERLTYNVPVYYEKIEKRGGRMKATNLHEFHSNKAESLLFKTLDDLSHELALDPIGLDGNECALSVGHGPGDRQVAG